MPHIFVKDFLVERLSKEVERIIIRVKILVVI